MKPLFAYPGGKTKLLDSILPFIPRDGVKTYVEPFAGGLAVLLAHEEPFPQEVVNDLDSEMINFYKMAAHHPDALIADLKYRLASRADFENEIRFSFRTKRTELARASSWYWLQRQSFGGKRQHFGRCKDIPHGVDVSRDGRLIQDFSERAKNVVFHSGDACDVIKKYDSPETFFFLDPPYVACADTAYDAFSEADMARLREVLVRCSGRWLLTCDDSAETRRVFDGFRAIGNTIRYTLSAVWNGKESKELMVFSHNFSINDSRSFEIMRSTQDDDFLFGYFF